MLNSRSITAVSVLTVTLIYIWSRYLKKRRRSFQNLLIPKLAKIGKFEEAFIETVEDLVLTPKLESSVCKTINIQLQANILIPRIYKCESIINPKNLEIEEEKIVCTNSAMINSVPDCTINKLASLSMSDDSCVDPAIVLEREDCVMSSSDTSEEMVTPTSSQTEEKSSTFPEGIFNDPDNDIVEDSPEIMNGRKIPRVLVPSDLWAEAVEKNTWRETFFVPASMGGVLIGRFGKNVRELKNQWNAEFSLNMCPGRQDTLLLKLSCPLEHKENVVHWITNRFKMRPSKTTIGNPNQLRRILPLGKFTRVQIRSLYGLKEFFVTMKDEDFEAYLSMQEELNKDYTTLNSSRMQLYEPVTAGTVAILPHNFGFARALILKVLLTWPRQAVCFLLDHGTFGVVGLSDLRKIKAKYMRIPFQAIHVSWAHALPIYCDVPDLHILRTFFSSDRICAYPVRMETCCRASVTLLDTVSETESNKQYNDALALACRSGLYMVSPLGLFPNRQMWLNRTNTPYYPCPSSEIDYTLLVEYYPEEAYPPNQLQPLGTSQSQNVMSNDSKSQNNTKMQQPNGNRGRGFRKQIVRTRRFRDPNFSNNHNRDNLHLNETNPKSSTFNANQQETTGSSKPLRRNAPSKPTHLRS